MAGSFLHVVPRVKVAEMIFLGVAVAVPFSEAGDVAFNELRSHDK